MSFQIIEEDGRENYNKNQQNIEENNNFAWLFELMELKA